MPRLRTLAPWLLALAALTALVAPHVPKDIFTPTHLALALAALVLLALATVVVLARRRRRRARPAAPDPQRGAADQAARALQRSLAAALHALGGRPRRTWLIVGPPRHGKSSLAAALLGPLRDVTAPSTVPRLLVAPDTRTLVLEHAGPPRDLRGLLRLRQPLDAVLLVVSLPDLAAADLAEIRTHLADTLRTLEVDVPIHLVCTHTDRLAGRAELGDPAPWTLALRSPDHLHAALTAWTRWVDAQRLARLAADPDPERRARLYTLGAAFARACDVLRERAAPLVATAPDRPALALRTVSFTALPDAPLPADRVLRDLAAELHLPLPQDPTPTTDAPAARHLDCARLRATLLAHDPEATRTPAHHRRAARRAHALAAALTALAAALALATATTTTRAHACLQDLADRTAPLAATVRAHAQRAAVADLHAALASPCAPADLPDLLRRAVRRHLLTDLWTGLERDLRPLQDRPPTTIPEQLAARDRLRAYLLLTRPDLSATTGPFDPVQRDTPEEPGPLDPAQRPWLAAELARRLPDPALAPALATFFDLAAPADLAFPRDLALVDAVRARLAARDDDEATLHAALAAADAACAPLALPALTHATHLAADRQIPCSFTRPGWDPVQQQLAAAVDQQGDWILGRAHGEPRERRLARLRERYDARYAEAWTDFLASVRVRRPTDLESAARLLAELTADDHPLPRIFSALDHHTRGLGRSRADLPAWLPSDAPGELHRAFSPLLAFTLAADDRQPGLARWHARLAEVLAALEAARSDPAALPDLRTRVSAALADTHDLLRRADLRRFRPLLSALLLPPLDALHAAVTDQDKLALVRTYCLELHAPLRQLASRYPFAPAAADDAPLADFTALFHPQTGALARLRDHDLAPWLAGQGPHLTAKPAPRADPHPLHPGVVALLRRAAAATQLAFPAGQLDLALDVDLRCNADIGRVTLTLAGARHTYACGPDARARMHWPVDPAADKRADVPEGALLELLGRDGRRQQIPGHGPWGLWRLLEHDLVTPPTDWAHDPLVFRLDLRTSRLGALDLALTPHRTAGETLLIGPDPAGALLLAPLRARDLLDPPNTLFHGLPGCPDLAP